MGSDRARVSFEPSRKWRGLVAQQGRVTLEADWNEASTIEAERDRLTTLDVVGPVGSPDGGYAVTVTVNRPILDVPIVDLPIVDIPVEASPVAASPVAASPVAASAAGVLPTLATTIRPIIGLGPVIPEITTYTMSIGAGTLYLGGQRLDLDVAVELDGSPQPDWLDQSTDSLWVAPAPAEASPPASPPGATNELVYLLAIEQEVSALEDPTLADVALGGPDTMQRTRILQRFVRWPTSSSDCADAWKEVQSAWNTIGLNFDPSTMRLESAARLQVSFDQTSAPSSPCQPNASGGFLGPENQLLRVQVTSVDPGTGNPTVVWGFDDASFLYELESAVPNGAGMVFTLAQSPVDQYHYPMAGQAVELLRDAAGLPLAETNGQSGNGAASGQAQSTGAGYIASASGFVSSVTSTYNPSQMSLAVSGQPPNDYLSVPATPQLYLRVWQASVAAPPGTAVDLEAAGATTGINVTLTSTEGFHAGDFWRFAVRPSVPQLVYPARVVEAPQPPDGARVWACPIALVSWPEVNTPAVTSCVPAFTDLVTLTARKPGCCTLNVSPTDLEGGATFQSILAPFAGQGPIRVCLSAGTYTLPAPLVLGTNYEGISIEGCSPGVIFQAPADPGAEFVLGLIVVEGAANVTIQGIQFELPLVPFTPAEGSFAALTSEGVSAANQALLEQYSQGMNVAIGISAQGCSGLVVENCTFNVAPPTGATSGTSGTSATGTTSLPSLFSAGIYATGSLEGVEVSNCTFTVDPAPATVPFYDLVAANQPSLPYQVTFGYLQVSITGTAQEATTLGQLHDAVIQGCLFDGLTVAGLAVAQLGTLRVDNNTVQDCYGGFWLVSLDQPALSLTFDLLPVGDNLARLDFVNLSMTALADGVFLIASAIARVLPTVPPAGAIIISRPILLPDPVLLSTAALGLQTFLGGTVITPEGSPPASGTSSTPAPAGSPPSSGGTGGAVATSAPSSTATATATATSGVTSAVPVEGTPVGVAPASPATTVGEPTVTTTTTETPVTSAPVTEAPVTSTPVTSTPVTETPVTATPVTETPVTETPVTETPVTETPVTETPVTATPVTEKPIIDTTLGTTAVAEPRLTEEATAPSLSDTLSTSAASISGTSAITAPIISATSTTTPVEPGLTTSSTLLGSETLKEPIFSAELPPTTLATLTTLHTLAPNLQGILGNIGGIVLLSPPALPSPPAVPLVSDTGTTVTLRLDVGDCQIDAVVAESWSGAALLVADQTSNPGSALVHGNRMRSRFPQGQTALIAGLAEVAVTGNIVSNEVATTTVVLVAEASALASGTYSLVLHPGTTTLSAAPVAIVGNVFIDLPQLPARSDTTLPSWDTFNAEIPYS